MLALLLAAAAWAACAAPAAGEIVSLPPGKAQEVVPAPRGGDLLFLRLKINEHDAGWFIADTGASHVTVHQAVADRLKLPFAGRGTVSGVGGTQNVTFREAQSIQIGGVVVKTGRVVAADLSRFSDELGVELAGVVGCELWALVPFTLDYQAKSVTFHDRAAFKPPADAQGFGLTTSRRCPMTAAVVEGKYQGQALLDTGRQGLLTIHPLYLAGHPEMVRGRKFTSGLAVGVAGERRSNYAALRTLEVLGRSFADVRTEFPGFQPDPKARAPYLGVLGGGCLRHFRLTFDYASNRLWAQWRPDPRMPDPPPPGWDPNAADFLGSTALHLAAADADAQTVGRLIRAGAKLDPKTPGGRTPLFVAASYGYTDVAEALIRAGADVNAATGERETPLMVACQEGHEGVVRALIAARADLEARSRGDEQAIRLAVGHGHAEIVRALLKAGCKVNAATAKGETALMLAARTGLVTIAQDLLDAGADPNAHNRVKERALLLAVVQGRTGMVKLLAARGADVNAPNAQGMTALMAAAFHGRPEVAQALLKAKADANARDLLDRTALMLAAKEGHLDVVQALIRHGADLNVRSRANQTALGLARANGHAEIARALLQAGAKP